MYIWMEFDRIYAEVDLGRIEENMKAMKEHLRPGTKMYGVVKTDAYGHGAVPVARTIDRFVCGYAVATVDEGIKLRRHGIEKGLSTAEISDKEAAKKLLALVPQEWIKRIPFFVRGHATTKTVERVAKQYPALYAVAKRQGDLPEKEGQELRKIMTGIFEEKMNKHKIK